MSRPSGAEYASRTVTDLRAEFDRRDLSRHLAAFYRSPETQLAVAATYASHGLETGHRCLYLADDNSPERVKRALGRAGVDVDARTEAGDLLVHDAEDVYLDAGFDPERMSETLEEAVEESREDGYEGLWVAGENTWSFHTDVPFGHVLEFEADFDAACPGMPVTALCQYDLEQFNEESIAKALWTHEQIIYRNALCENPYYVPPAEYQSAPSPSLNATLMLEQTFGLTRTRRQVRRREQRLAVVDRVLRHNIRNEMNVAHGNLELLAESAALSPENERRLATALEHLDAVVETAANVRRVQETLDGEKTQPTAVSALLARVARLTEEACPDATVDLRGDADATVRADANLDTALVELLTDVVLDRQSAPGTVTLRVDVPGVDTVRIDVRCPGLTISATERQALTRGEETPLEHPDGIELWFVKWVVQNSRGVLSFPDDDGVQIRVELQRR